MLLSQLLKLRPCLVLIALLSANAAVAEHRDGHIDVSLPVLTEMGKVGQKEFNQSCAECHGDNGAGTLKGPPLIHPVYNPGHHSDKAIYAAMRNGTRQHHWPYGDMPKQTVGFYESSAIVKFIREVQEANGIVSQRQR